jgi:sugar phosphate isomerase/epimerase
VGIKMNKTGIHYYFGYKTSNKERFKLIKEAGFDTVCLWWGNEFGDYDEDKNLLPERARSIGLEVENVHTPFQETNYIWTDSINAEAIVDRYKNCILDCSTHNIPTAVVHLSSGNTPPPISEIGLDRIKAIVELAESKGVNIALENLRKPEYLEYVFSNIQAKRLGFCYDSGHENCFTKGIDYLKLYGDKLMALHLHDNDGSDDQHKIPGEGTISWEAVARKIQATGYKGAMCLEISNEYSQLYSNILAEEFLKIAHEKAMNLGLLK